MAHSALAAHRAGSCRSLQGRDDRQQPLAVDANRLVHHPRSVQVEVRAREMRLRPALSEARLWQALRAAGSGSRLAGRRSSGATSSTSWRPLSRWWSRSMVAVVGDAVTPTRGQIECSRGQGIACCVSRVSRFAPASSKRLADPPATIDRNDSTCHERARLGCEPKHRARDIVRCAGSPEGRFGDDSRYAVVRPRAGESGACNKPRRDGVRGDATRGELTGQREG
jgi:hypothetical protein